MTILEIIWGIKTQAIFDVWSFEHLISGVSFGSAVKKKNHKILGRLLGRKKHDLQSYYFGIMGIAAVAYLWETIEHYLEIGLGGEWLEYWFQGVEFWPNRIVADPLLMILGYIIAKKYPKIIWPIRVLSITWVVVHLFVFPDSMYLHEIA